MWTANGNLARIHLSDSQIFSEFIPLLVESIGLYPDRDG
jgi:hypothetical protein